MKNKLQGFLRNILLFDINRHNVKHIIIRGWKAELTPFLFFMTDMVGDIKLEPSGVHDLHHSKKFGDLNLRRLAELWSCFHLPAIELWSCFYELAIARPAKAGPGQAGPGKAKPGKPSCPAKRRRN